jgi:hypothetical protein
MKSGGSNMLGLSILMLICFSGCQNTSKVSNNYEISPSTNTEIIVNQSPNKKTIDLKLVPPPNESKFTKTDGIIAFVYDEDNLKRENGLIHIYDEFGNIWNTINYYSDSKESMSKPVNEFHPYSFRASDFELKMRCTRKSNDWYEVIVQDESSPKVKKYIKANDPLFKFQTWEKYILNFSWVVFDQEKNPIFQSPNGKKKDVLLSKEMRFAPIGMKGDWIKIRLDKNSDNNTKIKQPQKTDENISGWIKWRNGDEILVYEYYP